MPDVLVKWFVGDAARELEGLRFAFNVPFGPSGCLALLGLVAVAVILFFWPKMARLPAGVRAFLIALRTAAVLLILFLLLDPCILGKRARPSERAVVLLFDDSKSMQVAGPDGQTRGQNMLASYEAIRSSFEEKLRRKCQLIFCRFGETIERIRSPQELSFEQNESDLTGAATRALSNFGDLEVAAVALLSDGVQQTKDHPADLGPLEKSNVPVFTVGIGADSQWRDLEVGPLVVKRDDFGENPVIAKVPVRASGLKGAEVIVEALLDQSVVATTRLKVESDASDVEARLEFVPAKKGWLEIEARARLVSEKTDKAEAPVERVAQNNTGRFLVDNREKTYRILYLCGRPNWENKFIRRALEEDKQLKMASLIRISGPEKTFKYRGDRSSLANPIYEGTDAVQDAPRWDEAVFLRLGVEASELAKGYPDRAEELYPYHLILWGEIEAGFFSQKQLELTRDYVRKRGGSLLLLGGRHSFTEGGFDGTLIESLLPARLNTLAQDAETDGLNPDTPYQAQPTVEGALSGAWSLDANPDENRRLWGEMAALYRINQFALTRPGATIQANAAGKNDPDTHLPLFAIQRYGEGRCAVLATDSTWQWKLTAEPADRKHERLWRQIVRSLVRQSPEPIRLRTERDTYTMGEPAKLEFTVRDALYDERESVNVNVTAAAPLGRATTLPVEESIQEAGLYSCEYNPQEPGMHRLTLTAADDQGKTVGAMEQAINVEPDRREFQRAQYNPSLLREIAARTKGEFLPIEKLAQLPDAIPWRASEQAAEARIHLWRFPGFYLLLAGLLIAEWFLRRRKGYR